MKSLHTLAPTQSPCDSHMTSEQYTWYSTSQCWNQHFRIQYRIGFNLRPHLSLSKTNPNSKSPKSSIPRLTTDVTPSCNILSDGQATKALTKKPLGSMPMSSGTPPNLLRISTWPIHPNQARTQIFEVQVTSLLSKFSHLITISTSAYYSFRVESSTTTSIKPASNLLTMAPNKAFCCSNRAFLRSLLSFNPTRNSLVRSKPSFKPISSLDCRSCSSLRAATPTESPSLAADSDSESSTRARFLDFLPFPDFTFQLLTRVPLLTVHTCL